MIFRSSMLALAVVALVAAQPAATAHAAKPVTDPSAAEETAPPGATKKRKSGTAVLKVQKALAEMGLYVGPIDGHLTEETRAAIRVYQKGAGLKVDGKLSKHLWSLLDNAVQVRALLKRLDTARESGKDRARQALLAHPATRDLVRDANRERADPTRDVTACFAEPTVRCLLKEASESIKAVSRPELRDWGLGELLVSQAHAGLINQAMDTARRMRDPRLIMVALRDIAEAQAAAGRTVEALAAVDVIPDQEKKAEALAAIAAIQVQRGDNDGAIRAIARLEDVSAQLRDPIRRISFAARAAVVLARVGDTRSAAERLAAAEAEARTRTDPDERGSALRHIASAMADMERPDQALNILEDIDGASERTSVLVSAATAQARAGDAAAALATAEDIDAVRYRAVVLGRIALAQSEAGDSDAAAATLALARAAVDEIKLPHARSYAVSRIALAMGRIGDAVSQENAPRGSNSSIKDRLFEAVDVARGIDDNRLRAHSLWRLAAAQRRAGDQEGAEGSDKFAQEATEAIKSRLSRVWMFADIAAVEAREGASEEGWRAFGRGLDVARDLDNAWARSRALSRLAATMIDLVDPDSGVGAETSSDAQGGEPLKKP